MRGHSEVWRRPRGWHQLGAYTVLGEFLRLCLLSLYEPYSLYGLSQSWAAIWHGTMSRT